MLMSCLASLCWARCYGSAMQIAKQRGEFGVKGKPRLRGAWRDEKEAPALHIKSVQSLNRKLKGWKAERKTEALPLAHSAFQPSSTTYVPDSMCKAGAHHCPSSHHRTPGCQRPALRRPSGCD